MRQDGGYAIGDKVPMGKAIVYSLQHLMAFVGGGAIVPAMIMGLNPALAVFCQLRPGAPMGKLAVKNIAVGTRCITSPTSVEPYWSINFIGWTVLLKVSFSPRL